MKLRVFLFVSLLALSVVGCATSDTGRNDAGSDASDTDCDSLIRGRHVDQKAAIYQWQLECNGWDPADIETLAGDVGIACPRAFRPPPDAQPSARVWGATCFPSDQSGAGSSAATTSQQSQTSFDDQTRRCVNLVLAGSSEFNLYSAGCSYAQRDSYDWFAVEQAKRQFQENYDQKTAFCQQLALDGATSTQLFIRGCDGSYFGAEDFDRYAVDQAKAEYDRHFKNQTEYCAALASSGASDTTMWMNNCDTAEPGVGTDFDRWEVEDAEREFEREQEAFERRCWELESSGADQMRMWSEGCY